MLSEMNGVLMDRREDIINFIIRCKHDLSEDVKVLTKKHKLKVKYYNSRENAKESRRKYLSSEKGKYASSKCRYGRREKIKQDSLELEWHEKILIGRFYKNCPEGYEVDHIFPLSKGGKHALSNLQYLTKTENRSKSNNIDWWDNNTKESIFLRKEVEDYLWKRITCSCVGELKSTRRIINEMFCHGMINSRASVHNLLEKWAKEGKYAYGRSIDLGWKVCDTKCIF